MLFNYRAERVNVIAFALVSITFYYFLCIRPPPKIIYLFKSAMILFIFLVGNLFIYWTRPKLCLYPASKRKIMDSSKIYSRCRILDSPKILFILPQNIK